MSVKVQVLAYNPADPAACLEGSTVDTTGRKVLDHRFKYFVHVTAEDIRSRKTTNGDNTDITLNDFLNRGIPEGLSQVYNDVPTGSSNPDALYNDDVCDFRNLLHRLKSEVLKTAMTPTDPVALGIITRLNNVRTKVQNVKTDEAQVTRLLIDYFLDNSQVADLFDNYIVNTTGSSLPMKQYAYYDDKVNAVGFGIDTRRWAATSLKKRAELLVNKESFEFDALFNTNPKSVINPAGVEFKNINGKLVRLDKDGTQTPADFDHLARNAKTVFGESCNALGLDNQQCDDFLAQCQKDRPDECQRFMDGINSSNFLNMVKKLKYVDPLHIKWVVEKFAWPSYVKDGVRVLKHTDQWLNPNNYSNASEADLMKKIKTNTNLVAFFQAVKATTDAFPAILNPNYTGSGVANPFAVQVQDKSRAGKYGLKALITQNPLGLTQYKETFLKIQTMVNNNMSNLVTGLGITNLLPAPFVFGRVYRGGASSDSQVTNDQVQAYLNRLNRDGTGYVPSAKYTRKIWKDMMDNLRNRYSMDVSAIDNDVTNYLNNLEDYQGRTHKAIAYVKVFTDNLVANELNGQQAVPYALTRDVLDDLTNVRDKLLGKTTNKDNTFWKNLFELLDRLEKKLNGKN
jgi:hypothetical protein